MASDAVILKTSTEIKIDILEQEAKKRIEEIFAIAEAQKLEILTNFKMEKKRLNEELKKQIKILKDSEKASKKVAKMKLKMENAIKQAESEVIKFSEMKLNENNILSDDSDSDEYSSTSNDE